MSIQQLNNLNLKAGLEANGDVGEDGQVLSSTGPNGVEWINQSAITASSDFIYYEVKNETGSTILKGKGVMAVGTDGNSGHILVDEMVADGTITPRYFLGVLETDIENGGFARVIAFGELDQFNTNGQNGETWSNGQVLWCDPDSPGDFTIIEPLGPNVKIPAAFVLKASTQGKIQVRVQANEGVKDLYDTKIDSQVDGDVLVWDNTTGVWFNNDTLSVKYSERAVAIGDFTPPISGKLQISNEATDVWGTLIQLNSTGVQSRMSINNNGTGDSQINFQLFGSSKFTLGVDNSDSDKFKISGSSVLGSNDRLVIDSSGNVGIGTTNPSAKLDVVGRVKASGLDIDGTGNADTTFITYTRTDLTQPASIIYDGTGGFKFNANGLIYSFTDNTGLGVGTTSPEAILHINGTEDTTYWGPLIKSTSTNPARLTFTNTEGSGFIDQNDNALRFYHNGGYRMYINSLGKVGIGTTSPASQLSNTNINSTDQAGIGHSSTAVTWRSNNQGYTATFDNYLDNTVSNGLLVKTANTGTASYISKFESGGINRMAIRSDGNVGIGTTSPDSKLQISGSGTQRLRVTSTDGANADLSCDGTSSMTLGSPNGIPIRFVTSNAERMRITSSGNVGIGTTAPNRDLVVSDATNAHLKILSYTAVAEAQLTFATISSDTLYEKSAIIASGSGSWGRHNMHFCVNNAASSANVTLSDSRMMIDYATGNVGIGTTSPGQKLSVEPGADVSAEIGRAHIGNVGYAGYAGFSHVDKNSAGNYALLHEASGQTYLNASAAQNIRFRINNTDKMILTSGGNFGVGTTSPSQKLQVAGSILANGAVYSGSTTHGFVSYFGNTDIQTSSGGSVLVRNALTYRPIQASAFTVSSDYRLKSNITPLENAIDRLNQLNVHRFNWSDRLDEPKVDGFIAHEVSPIIPEAVLGEKDEVYEDGTPKHQGIDQAKIVPLLTAALQEAILKIEQLETRIQTLENN